MQSELDWLRGYKRFLETFLGIEDKQSLEWVEDRIKEVEEREEAKLEGE